MIVVNETLLDEFRGPGPCEWCGKPCKRREPHHLWARGIGGGSRMDIRINLIALGHSETFQCGCHKRIHAGGLDRHQMIEVVAKRERTDPDLIQAVVWLLCRTPKGARPNLADLEGGEAELLGKRVLEEIERSGDGDRTPGKRSRRRRGGIPENGSGHSDSEPDRPDAGADAGIEPEGDHVVSEGTVRRRMTFFVPGLPVSQPRQRHRVVSTEGGTSFVQNYTPTKSPVNAFKATVRLLAAQECRPLTGPVGVSLLFVFPTPKSLQRKSGWPCRWKSTKPDLDNLEKAVLDALKGIAWADDAQVALVAKKKVLAAPGQDVGVHVEVFGLDEIR